MTHNADRFRPRACSVVLPRLLGVIVRHRYSRPEMAVDDYPPLADPNNIAKNWMDALLQNCGVPRMKLIAADYGLTGYSRMAKEDLFKLLFNHMLTLQECEVCQGDCDPNGHIFKATEAPPENVSPPPTARNSRSTSRTSPSSFVGQNDNSKDNPVTDSDGNPIRQPLYTGQPGAGSSGSGSPHLDKSPMLPLNARIMQGGRTFQPDADVLKELANTQKQVQEKLDQAEKDEDERRRLELLELEGDSEASSEDELDVDEAIAEQTKKQELEALAKHKAKELAHAEKLQALKDAKAAKKAKSKKKTPAPVTVRIPRGPIQPTKKPAKKAPSKKPGKKSPGITFNVDEVQINESDDEDAEDDVFSGSISPRSMVKYMADSMAKALDRRDRVNGRSININTADPGNINSVPGGAPNTGRLALRSVPNTQMADRFGVAPPPNMMIEGDPTSLEFRNT